MVTPIISVLKTVIDKDCELTQVGPPLNSLSYGIGVRNGEYTADDLTEK